MDALIYPVMLHPHAHGDVFRGKEIGFQNQPAVEQLQPQLFRCDFALDYVALTVGRPGLQFRTISH